MARLQEQGFALTETIVAVAIMAGMTGLLYETIASNARTSQLVEQRRAAISLAQSALAQATISVPPAELQVVQGSNGYVAAISIENYDTNARSGGPPLEHVIVTVSRPPQSAILARLETLRLKK